MSDWNLEISAELSETIELRLREFGQDAELDLALLVDDSGSMVAGVASRQDVDVATVGVMVATSYGGLRSLSKALGDDETGDCVVHGSDNNIYLRSITDRFVLLAVSELTLPIGVVREKAAQVSSALNQLLLSMKAQAQQPSQPSNPPQSVPPASPSPQGPGPQEGGDPKYVFEIG